jgi:hypothetical protein
MSFTKRLLLSPALLASLLCAPVQASDYELGTSVVCDTQAQVERFVAVFDGDPQAAIRNVNTEQQNPSACVIKKVAFMRGFQVGMARNGDKAFEIVRILVVGIQTASGILRVPPSVHFSLFGLKEHAV